ncbi:hypothetical protein O5D80_007453 [Batrachochytrium dendrobatidis]|nr:hypothetical protein O5D80_007453 [Batrachochytrium dendrobatidis]
MNQPSPSASKQSRKQSTDEPGLDIPDKDWQRLIDEVNSDTFEEWKELFDIAGLNTPSQVSDPIDQVDPNTFDKYQQQPTDQPSSSISDQTQQHPIDATDLNISNKDPQQPIDQSSPSTSSQGRKRPIDETSQNTCSQAPGSTNEPSPSTSDEYWKPLFDIINPNIPSQDPIDEPSPSTSCKYWIPLFVIINPNIPSQDPINEPSPSTSKRSRKRRIDQPIPSTSRQDQQQPMEQDQHQPMEQGESGNTVPNQATVLNEQDQRTFNRIKKRLVASKKIAKEKREEYREYAIIGLEHKLVLAMGEEISEPRHNPNIEEKLRKEYIVEGKKVPSIRQELKIFMKRRGLEFQEPDSDSD